MISVQCSECQSGEIQHKDRRNHTMSLMMVAASALNVSTAQYKHNNMHNPITTRMYVQNVPCVYVKNVTVCTGTTPACVSTSARGAGRYTRGLFERTNRRRFERTHAGFFSLPHHTPQPQAHTQHQPTNQPNNTNQPKHTHTHAHAHATNHTKHTHPHPE